MKILKERNNVIELRDGRLRDLVMVQQHTLEIFSNIEKPAYMLLDVFGTQHATINAPYRRLVENLRALLGIK